MKIKQAVLEVLSTMECAGNEAKIAAGQLDRKLYVEVNKVLESLGGKWNRKAKAHLFNDDAASLLDAVITTGEVTTNREIGFFETPAELASKLCLMADIKAGDTCLEPSAGTGRIISAMVAAGAERLVACERDSNRRRDINNLFAHLVKNERIVFGMTLETDDFMNVMLGEPVDRVVMNPPFTKVGIGDHLNHVKHAFTMLKPRGILVSVLPVSVEFRQDRRYREFRAWYEELSGELTRLPDDSFKESGTGVRTCVLKITKG